MLDAEAFDDIACADVFVVLEGHTAFLTDRHFGDFVLEALERLELAFVDDVKAAMSGLLKPERRETFIGYAQILEVFQITKVGKVAGCRVTEGTVRKGAKVRIVRENVVVLELGTLQTLKRFKDEVNEVPSGQECGMMFQGFQDIRVGDTIECFSVEMVARSL